MRKGTPLKRLAWVLAVELALMQPAFAQADDGATEPAPAQESGPLTETAPAPDATSAESLAQSEAAPAAGAEAPADAEDEEAGPRGRMMEEIVVTATKREENLQDVASSVQAFSAGQLDAQGVSDIKDMQLVTPGLTYDSMASYSIIFIRGVGGDAFQAGIDSSVATYIDGLYLPFTFSSAQALGDVKQVEVLKGPQGTLYGRNAIAGAIKVELKEPCSDEWCGDFMQQFGNFNDTKTKLAFSGPVPFTNNTVSIGASGLYEQHDAHDQYYLDPKANFYRPYRNAGHRLVARWEPNDDFDIQGSYYDLRNQDSDSVITVLIKESPAFENMLTAIDKPHQSGNQENVGVEAITRIKTVTANARWAPWFDTKLVYGNISAESTILFDYDSAPEPVLDISAVPNTADSDIAELIFSSNPAETADWLEWIGGVYYEDTLKTGRYPIKLNPVDLALGTAFSNIAANTPASFLAAFPFPSCSDIGVDCDADSDTNVNPYLEIPLLSGVTTDAISAYAQFTFHVTDATSLVIGGRASKEKRELVYSGYNQNFIIPAGNPLNLTGEDIVSGDNEAVRFRPQQHTWNSFTPNLGLNYKYSDETLFYYRYAEAFKSGNFNGLNVTDPPDRIEPELAASNEVGMKTELFNNAVKFNSALFTTRVSNAQVQNLSLASGGVTSLQNAATYTVKGAELEVQWYALDGLVLSLSGVYLDGTYGSFNGRAFRPETGVSDESIDFSGNKTVRTPEYSGTVAVNYTFPFVLGLEAEAGVNCYFNDGFYYDPLNTLVQVPYQILGANFGVFDPRSNVRLTIYGKNLLDDVYYSQVYRQDFGDTAFYGQDLTYGGYVTWSF